jgi:hypothetical protein
MTSPIPPPDFLGIPPVNIEGSIEEEEEDEAEAEESIIISC